jgi:hypothetical protein
VPEKSESGEELKSLQAAVPQIFYDLIGRIIPGAAMVSSYTFNATTFKEMTLATELLGLMVCYLIGFILQMLGSELWSIVAYPRFKSLGKHFEYFKIDPEDSELWHWIHTKTTPLNRDLFFKRMAEKTMLWSLSIGSLVWIAIPPKLFQIWGQGPILARCTGLLTFLGFTFSVIKLHKSISKDKNDYEKAKP